MNLIKLQICDYQFFRYIQLYRVFIYHLGFNIMVFINNIRMYNNCAVLKTLIIENIYIIVVLLNVYI